MPECASSITPDSKVGELLERWPALEAVLLDLSPHFAALRNPVLRRTIAKVATLRHVASVGGVPLGVLLEKLRAGAGLPRLALDEDVEGSVRPAWADGSAVTSTHDAREEIESGVHPMARVLADLGRLGDGEVHALVTPFVPAPLLDLAREKTFESFSVREGGLVRTFFRRGGGRTGRSRGRRHRGVEDEPHDHDVPRARRARVAVARARSLRQPRRPRGRHRANRPEDRQARAGARLGPAEAGAGDPDRLREGARARAERQGARGFGAPLLRDGRPRPPRRRGRPVHRPEARRDARRARGGDHRRRRRRGRSREARRLPRRAP